MSFKPIHILSRSIILDNNKILLAKDLRVIPSFYYVPGGHVETGESAVEALKRELLEELGISFEIKKFLGCLEYSFIPNKAVPICHTHEYNFLFLATSQEVTSKVTPLSQESHLQFEWISIKTLNQINLLPPPLKNCIPKWLEKRSYGIFLSHMIKENL